jgi:hypothetical protein
MKLLEPSDWDRIKGDLSTNEAFLEVRGKLGQFEGTLPEGMDTMDIVAAAAAQANFRHARHSSESAIKISVNQVDRHQGYTLKTAEEMYETGQTQASLAFNIMHMSGVSMESVRALPPSVSWELIPQIMLLEEAIQASDFE